MMRAVFGIADPGHLADLHRLIPELLRINPALLLFPRLRRDLGPWSPWGRFSRIQRDVDQILYDEIRRHRNASNTAGRKDVLTLLLRAPEQDPAGLSDAELRDHLVTLLAVGHETTATALAWVLERMTRHPAVMARARAGLDRQDDAYLEAVINETLRVRPVTMDIARTTSRESEIGGHLLPVGTMVALSLSLLHSSPAIYTDPGSFIPERFLDVTPAPYHFLPFGGGTHRCLGASFAMMEMTAILRSILRLADLRSARAKQERIHAVGPILVPSRQTEVIIERRAGAWPPASARACGQVPC